MGTCNLHLGLRRSSLLARTGLWRPQAGRDKFAADMAVELKDYGVATLSIWMGALLTEWMGLLAESEPTKFGHLEATLETGIPWPHHLGSRERSRSDDDERTDGYRSRISFEVPRQRGRRLSAPSYRETHGVAPRVQYSTVIRP